MKHPVRLGVFAAAATLMLALAVPAVAGKPAPVPFPELVTETLEIRTGTDWLLNDGQGGTPVAVDCRATTWNAQVPSPWTKDLAPSTWIWVEPCGSDGAQHTFSKSFDVPGSIVDAEMQVAADNEVTASVNGAVVDTFGWFESQAAGGHFNAFWTPHEVSTDALTAGTNTVSLSVRNWAWSCSGTCNPGGVVATLTVTYRYFLPPTAVEHCNSGAWELFTTPSFVHQGDCVSYVMTEGKNQPGIGNDEHPDGVGDGVNNGGSDDSDDDGDGEGNGESGDKGHDETHEDNGAEGNGHEPGHDDNGQDSDSAGTTDGDEGSTGIGSDDGGEGHDATHVDNGAEDNGHEEGHDDNGQNEDPAEVLDGDGGQGDGDSLDQV